MGEERRRRYRLSTESLDPLRVEVATSSGDELVAEVTDLNAEGTCLYVPPAGTSALEVGQRVELRFHGAVLAEPFEMPAVVRRRRSCDDGDDYGVEFLDGDLRRRTLPPEVRWLFNVRSTLRVKPDAGESVEVEITADDHTSRRRSAALHDVSVLGVSVFVRIPVDLWLASAESVRISFTLPGDARPLGFVGRVLRSPFPWVWNEEAADSDPGTRVQGIHYAIVFDERRTERFSERQKRIADYVLERQRQVQEEVLSS